MKTSAAVATILGASISLGQPTHVKNMDPGNFTVALVRAPPANLPYPPPSEDWYGRQYDLDRTVEIGLGYIHEAALKGANLVAFPELWFPGYYFGSYEGPSAIFSNYLDQGLTINSTNWQKLVRAAADNDIWLVFGFAHLQGDSVYMAQAMVDSNGQIVQLRHKLRPSGTERTMFSDGTTDMLQVHRTDFGRVGMLQCWEHMWPSEVFAMHSQIENIHIASFPWAPDLAVDTGVTRAEVSIAAARLYAVTGSTWVLMPAVGTAAIIAPNGTIVAQVEASDCPVAQPMIYHSIDTTSFVGTPAYQADGEYSYAALKQVDAAFPAYIPQDEGIYIARRENSVREMRKAGPIPLPYA